jgi:hypothetical protein
MRLTASPKLPTGPRAVEKTLTTRTTTEKELTITMLTTTLSRKGRRVRLVVVLMAVLVAAMTAVIGRPASAEIVPGYYNVSNKPVAGNASTDVDTEITLKTGDRVVVSADGKINPGCLNCSDTGPAGYSDPAPDDGWPLKGARQFSLLGKINGQYFYIGAGKDWVHTGGPGNLYLYVNDWKTDDNRGAFFADIRVDRDVPSPANIEPEILDLSPAPGSEIKELKPLISATVRDAETDLSASNIKLFVDGNARTFTYDKASDKLTYQSDVELAEGQHTVRIEATDEKGEQTVKDWSFRIVNPAPNPGPNSAPEIVDLSPTPGSKIKNRAPLISAAVRDAQTDLSASNIKFFVDGSARTFAYDQASDKLTYQSANLNRGQHTVRIEATDEKGRQTVKDWSFRIVKKK